LKKAFISQGIVLTSTLMALCAFIFVTAGGFRGTAGVFPRIVSSVTFLLLAVQLGFEIRGTLKAAEAQSAQKPKEGNTKNFWITVAGLFVYTALIFSVGFFPATFIYMLASTLLYGYKKNAVAFLTSFGMCLFIYFVFVFALGLQLPTGLFY